MAKTLLVLLLILLIPTVSHGKSTVTSLRASDIESYSRFVIESDSPPRYNLFILSSPPRVVIDIADSRLKTPNSPTSNTLRIKNIRHSQSNGILRIVLNTNQPVTIKKEFTLPPSQDNKSYRLVVDIEPVNKDLDQFIIPEPVARSNPIATITPVPQLKKQRKPLIVIDAGHGGHDPGAIGRKRTKEKNLTLKYSKEIRRMLLPTGRFDVYMTRSTDKYLKLRERVSRARKAKGDLFISIHANSHKNRKTRGLSVYTLSENASDKEAAALARKENKSGIINGLNLEEEEDELTALFIDMAQRDTKNQSASFAELLVDTAKNKIRLLRRPHRFAGFRVLTGADIPSVLIEIGYITNRKEEKLLKSEKYKKKLAKAIVEAIDIHFGKYK